MRSGTDTITPVPYSPITILDPSGNSFAFSTPAADTNYLVFIQNNNLDASGNFVAQVISKTVNGFEPRFRHMATAFTDYTLGTLPNGPWHIDEVLVVFSNGQIATKQWIVT